MRATTLDIIIPVYNEGKKIVKLLQKLKRDINYNYRVLICYDNKSDSSLRYIRRSIIKKNINFIKNPSKGPNNAIKEGIKKSTSQIILIYMADDFYNTKLINKMVQLILRGNDLVIPSRFISGGKFIGGNFFKKSLTYIGSIMLNSIIRFPYKDCTNAFKMFNSKVKKKIKIVSKEGFTFALELTIKSYFNNFKIIEIPSVWKDVKYRKSNFKVIKWLPYYVYWLYYLIIKKIYLNIK
jgi:dolichol-phosphate mannosyltransferase